MLLTESIFSRSPKLSVSTVTQPYMGASQRVYTQSWMRYAIASHASCPASDMPAGIAKSRMTDSGIATTDILSHGMNLLPLLNLTLSNSAPKIASLKASHTLTSTSTNATFSASMPCRRAKVVRYVATSA